MPFPFTKAWRQARAKAARHAAEIAKTARETAMLACIANIAKAKNNLEPLGATFSKIAETVNGAPEARAHVLIARQLYLVRGHSDGWQIERFK